MKIQILLHLLSIVPVMAVPASHSSSKSLPGGWAPAPNNRDIGTAAEVAVREQSKRENVPLKLARISEPQTQIVAGINYRFTLTLDRKGSQREAKVVVFRGLDSHYSLTSWMWLAGR